MVQDKLQAFLGKFFFALIVTLVSCKEKKDAIDQISEKPNVLFILADDLGVKDLGYAGSTFYETPNIDALANSGAIFTNGYASAQVCSPSRASIMLGQFTARHGITDWIGAATGHAWSQKGTNTKLLPPEYEHSMKKSDVTIAEIMKNNGYNTFFAGKWHLGGAGSHPEDHGFDINKGGWDVGSPKGGYFSPWENPKLPNKAKGENLSMRLAKETVEFMKMNKEQPFFAFLSFYAVHGPIQTTKEKWQKYRNKAEHNGIGDSGFEMERVLPIRTVQDNPVYAGLVESMDDAIGHILNNLKELGLDGNTIIMFTSDNGGVASGDAYSTANLPFRGGKGYQWEGGIREPYLIKVPWLEQKGQKIDYPAAGSDFFPTILDLTNIREKPAQHLDGVSLKPLLLGENLVQRPLYWHYPHYGNQGGEPVSMIREGDWKLIYYWEDGDTELYNLAEDIGEKHDISTQKSQRTKSLTTKLMAFLDEVNAKTPEKNKGFNEKLSEETYQHRTKVLLPRLEAQRKAFLSPTFQPNENWWDSQITID